MEGIYIVVFIQKGGCGCNAIRGIGSEGLFLAGVERGCLGVFKMVLVNLLVMQVCMRSRGK